jgi:predicted aldo/keto reductase-like oxidoreductase
MDTFLDEQQVRLKTDHIDICRVHGLSDSEDPEDFF